MCAVTSGKYIFGNLTLYMINIMTSIFLSLNYFVNIVPANGVWFDTQEHALPKCFPGVTLKQIAFFEKCFEISLNIFLLNEDKSVQSVYQS